MGVLDGIFDGDYDYIVKNELGVVASGFWSNFWVFEPRAGELS